MPAWLLKIIKLAIQLGGPALLSWIKSWLESKYPEWAKVIEDLINDLKNPSKSNSASRKQAKERVCTVGCSSDTKSL